MAGLSLAHDRHCMFAALVQLACVLEQIRFWPRNHRKSRLSAASSV